MTRFSKSAELALHQAGWRAGREAADVLALTERTLATDFVLFDAARSAILEFGGLTLNLRGPGVDVPLARVEFNPSLAWGEEDRFRKAESDVSSRLYPLGELDNGHFFIGISDVGAVYLISVVLVKVARTMDMAIEAFVAGRREQQMIAEDEER